VHCYWISLFDFMLDREKEKEKELE